MQFRPPIPSRGTASGGPKNGSQAKFPAPNRLPAVFLAPEAPNGFPAVFWVLQAKLPAQNSPPGGLMQFRPPIPSPGTASGAPTSWPPPQQRAPRGRSPRTSPSGSGSVRLVCGAYACALAVRGVRGVSSVHRWPPGQGRSTTSYVCSARRTPNASPEPVRLLGARFILPLPPRFTVQFSVDDWPEP